METCVCCSIVFIMLFCYIHENQLIKSVQECKCIYSEVLRFGGDILVFASLVQKIVMLNHFGTLLFKVIFFKVMKFLKSRTS